MRHQFIREKSCHNLSDIDDSSRRVEATDLHTILRRTVGQLPESLRVAIVLNFSGELTQSKIAEKLNTTQATISHRIKKGLDILRKRLSAAGVTGAYAISPALISDAILKEKASASILRKILRSGSASTRIVRGVQETTAPFTKILWLSILGVSTAAVLTVTFAHPTWFQTEADHSSTGSPTSGESLFHFTDTMEEGLKKEWHLYTVTESNGKAQIERKHETPDINAFAGIRFEKIPEMKSKRSLVMNKDTVGKYWPAIILSRPVLPGTDAIFSYSFYMKKSSALSTIKIRIK